MFIFTSSKNLRKKMVKREFLKALTHSHRNGKESNSTGTWRADNVRMVGDLADPWQQEGQQRAI